MALADEVQLLAPYLCPELRLWLLPPDAPSWHATDPTSLGMPYWAFAWPGGQALARYVLDHPGVVRGRRVLDFGSGCALEGIAAALAGADVTCADIDPVANAWAHRNAEANGVRITTSERNLIGDKIDFDLVLVGDALYSPELAAGVLTWLHASKMLIGDPLRVPEALAGFTSLQTYDASFDGDPRGLTLWKTAVLTNHPQRLPLPSGEGRGEAR